MDMRFFLLTITNANLLPALSRDVLSGAGGFSLTAPALAALSRLQSNDTTTLPNRIAKMLTEFFQSNFNESHPGSRTKTAPCLCTDGPCPRSIGPSSACGPLSTGCRRVGGRSVPWGQGSG